MTERRPIAETPKKAGRFVVEIVAAALIGAGVPLLWIWIGSLISSARGATGVEASTAIVIAIGIIVTYVVVVLIAAAIQARSQPPESGPRHTRHPWLRSMRDEPYRPGTEKLSPVEAVFVGTAIVASIAMMIWFFAFAGSPLPA
jgi:multisubunit Na+/H+ antiporter MnhC subunit